MTDTPVQFRSEMGVTLVDSMASDQSVVRSARVSTVGANDGDDGEKLIGYLIREGHWSPLMHSAFTVLVECPVSTARQVFKHTVGVVFNERSGRYSELQPVFHLPARERPLVQTGRVGHYQFEEGSNLQYDTVTNARKSIAQSAWWHYQEQLRVGVAKEVARDVLPLSLYTQFYMSLNARSLLHFLDLRLDHVAQQEIQEVAQGLAKIMADKMPITYSSWLAYSKS